MKKKILITGASGLLGSNLIYCLKEKYDFCGLYHSHAIKLDGIPMHRCDLRDSDEVKKIMQNIKPDIVIHCAAEANVDKCELDPDLTRDVNVNATRHIAEQVNGSNVKLIYISTDLIYDGTKGNYSENDHANPRNVYAQSKFDGEQVALKVNGALALRTNFFGWSVNERESLGEWVINGLRANKRLQGFTDTQFSSIYTFDLAHIIDHIIQKNLSGIYNLGSKGSLSKNNFAVTIADRLKLNSGLIEPISIDEFQFKAQRSKNLSLDVSKLEKDLDAAIPSIEESIEHFVRDAQTELPKTFKGFRCAKSVYPPLEHISYGRQSVDDKDIEAVVDVLKSECLTQGPKGNEFENKLCAITGAKYCVSVNSGTSALHIACLAAGVKPGDEVITSPNSFVASANCAVYCGAQPVFADIDSQTYNIDPQAIKAKITEKTKAIIPVHFAGQSCDMKAIKELAGKNITIIEDAAHALGSKYQGTQVGSCAHSDMAIMSFHPVKHITTGEGGAVLTNDKELYNKLKILRSHGITNDPDRLQEKAPGRWYYEQQILGFNYRMTDIQCALGLSQLDKLPAFIEKRRAIVDMYNEAFRDHALITTPVELNGKDSNFHLYVIQIDFNKAAIDRKTLMNELKDKNIYTQVHYIPIHTQPYYRKHFDTNWGDYPVCEDYYNKCLSIPLYPSMSDADVQKVIADITGLIGGDVR